MAAALPFATSAIGGLLGGIGASRSKTSTYSNKSSGTQEGVLQGKQNKVNKILGQQLIDWLRLGPQVSQGDKDTLNAGVTDQVDAATNKVSSDLAARGMSNSGVKGRTFKDINVAGMKAKQSGLAGLQNTALQRFFQAMGLGLQYDQPRQFNTTSEQSGTQTVPGQNPFSSIGAGMGDLSSMLFMRNMGMLGGGGGGPFNAAGTGGATGGYPCWIAAAVYGKNDWRVTLIRHRLNRKASESKRWRALLALYKVFGRPVSMLVGQSHSLKIMFRSLFDQIVFAAT